MPGDGKAQAEYALLMRERGEVRVVHDRHETGLFPRATWIRLLQEAGFDAQSARRPIGNGETDEVFLCRRPLEPVVKVPRRTETGEAPA